VYITAIHQVDSAFYPLWDGEMKGWEVKASLACLQVNCVSISESLRKCIGI